MRTEAETTKLVDDLVMQEGLKITHEMAFSQITEVLSDDKKFLIMLRFLLCMARVEFESQDASNVPVEKMFRHAAQAARSLVINYYARQDAIEEILNKEKQ